MPAQNNGTVTPTPTIQQPPKCTAAGQTGCLVPCPTCGNGMIEFPEQCDGGNAVNCDGCSNFCRDQNCNDSNGCTTDSCDATLGCRNQPIVDGTSCTDGNVCNGVEACLSGLCRPSTPPLNCNDTNVCTTDSCNATLGCQNVPATGAACNDSNACTRERRLQRHGRVQPGGPRTCVDGLAVHHRRL